MMYTLQQLGIWGKCFICKKYKLFVHKRSVYLAHVKQTAMSKEPFCRKCFKDILKAQEDGILQ